MSNNPLDTQTTVNTPDEVVTTEPVEINADNPLGADQTDSSPSSGWGKFLTTAGGILTSIIGKIGQKKRDKEAREYQEKMYQQSLQDQKDLRDNEREYQSPLSQLTRLKEAGLNSHLMYGKGNLANSTQSTSAPSRVSVQPLSSPIPDMKLSPLDSLTMQQMLLNMEEKKQDIISKKISNEIADKTTDAQNFKLTCQPIISRFLIYFTFLFCNFLSSQFQIIIYKTNGSHPYCANQHHLYIYIRKISQQQCWNDYRKNDDDSSHCRCSSFAFLASQPLISYTFSNLSFLQELNQLLSIKCCNE